MIDVKQLADNGHGPRYAAWLCEDDGMPVKREGSYVFAVGASEIEAKAKLGPKPSAEDNYSVSRCTGGKYGPDSISVSVNGIELFHTAMGPGGKLHPRTAAEAKSMPWWYTGSPFGREIVNYAVERGVLP